MKSTFACRICGYDVEGLGVSGSIVRCPECGVLVDTSDPHQLRSWPKPPTLVAALAAPGLICGALWWLSHMLLPESRDLILEPVLTVLTLGSAVGVALVILRKRAHPAEWGLLAMSLTLLAMGLSLSTYMLAHLLAQYAG